MILVLTAAARDGWHHLVTGDESWFFFTYSPRRMWILTRDDMATKRRPDIHTKKSMFTVLWNPLGFCVVDTLRTDAKKESDYFTTNVLAAVERKVFPTGRNPHAKPLTIHLDNCSIHTIRTTEENVRQHNIIRLKHPPYSTNLAPSDFYLFPTIKEKPINIQMAHEQDLFSRLHEILNGISGKELDKVFRTWINRLMIV
jgi:histone-lysine N-methyltransferase SETMAR